MEKKKISVEEATKMLLSSIDDSNFRDDIYSMAHEYCMDAVEKINEKYLVVDADGEPYDGEHYDAEWYDEPREDFMGDFFEAVKEWLDGDTI